MRYVNTNTSQIITFFDLVSIFPNTSFPEGGPSETWLSENDYAFLIETPQPIAPVYKVYFEDGAEPTSSGWEIKWSLRDMTTDEVDAYNSMISSSISNYRKSLEFNIVTYEIHSSYCDKESETGLSECINNIMDNGGDKTISWQGPSGYTVAGLDGLSGLRKNVVDYRQRTRDAERLTIEYHSENPFETIDEAVEYFDSQME